MADPTYAKDWDLEISRFLKAKRSLLWDAWTKPELLVQWWCPRPWRTDLIAFEPRPGGAFDMVLRGPEGEENPVVGSFLEVVPQERIVWTTALGPGWRPSDATFLSLTAFITMADEADGTRYVARVLHKDRAESKRHEDMGFFEGWNTCITQLEELVAISV